jgi:hypothetical protein
MTPAPPSPRAVLDRLHGWSPEIREGVVLDARGRRLAGSAALAGPARDLLAQAPDAHAVEVALPRGAVYAMRGDHRSLAVVTTRGAMPGLVRYDLRMALRDLDTRVEKDDS